jgi:hypothetical protein
MNRLDKHVALVRNKLTTERFLLSLGYAAAVLLMVLAVLVLVNRMLWWQLPHALVWFWSGVAAVLLVAWIDALWRRPSPHQAASLIDEKLGLKEKFSTALFARSQGGNANDPFVIAAVRDAEQTAENVSLYRRFPLAVPKSVYSTLVAGLVLLLLWGFVPKMDLFHREEKLSLAKARLAEREAAKQAVKNALAAVNSAPVAVPSRDKVELAKKELQHLMDQPMADPTVEKLTAKKAEEAAQTAKLEEIKNNQAFAQASADNAVFNSLNPGADDHGPVADASRSLANNDFAKAIDQLGALPQKFNEMSADQQDKAVQQMKALQQQLSKIANDPQAMQNLQQMMQQQGISQLAAQQAAKLAQQAAQGSQAAQSKLQQMQKDLLKQMNNGKGPTPQQQQAIQQAMQQMQSVAKSQSTAQQMSSGAQQLLQGMQLAQASTQQGGQQAGKSGQQAGQKSGQQASAQQPGGQQAGQQSGQQPRGQQPGGQQPGGQQPGQQGGSQQANAQGQQPGGNQPGGQGAQQQMQQASQQMTQALGEMDAVKKDAEQVAAAQNANDQGSDGGNGDGKQPGEGGEGGQGQGGRGQGGNGAGQGLGAGGGGAPGIKQAPFGIKQQMDASKNIDGGRILAKTFVKADQLPGKSTLVMTPAAKAAIKESTDDVNEESVPKDAQNAVKEYFDNVGH